MQWKEQIEDKDTKSPCKSLNAGYVPLTSKAAFHEVESSDGHAKTHKCTWAMCYAVHGRHKGGRDKGLGLSTASIVAL